MPTNKTEVASIAGGCFWCMEAIFLEIKGVQKVESGYSGGDVPNPTYEQVCTGKTGHAETVQITFDPKIISYKQILQIFFTMHDPTTPNRQGSDFGTQYRSVIFYKDKEQKEIAEEVKKEIEGEKVWDKPTVTEIVPLKTFYKAEEYHQNYFKNNPLQPYCMVVILPKVLKLRKKYYDMLKKNDSKK